MTTAAARTARAEVHDWEINSQVQFRMWIDDGQDVIYGFYLIFNESAGDTRDLTERARYQDWARTMGFGIIGTQFSDGDNDTEHSGDVLEAMSQFAQMSQHPEIANAPVITEGISLGGFNSIQFATIYPERTIAYLGGAASRLPADTSSPQFVLTPGLFYHGELDTDIEDATRMRDLFLGLRGSGAQVAFWTQWGAEHERLFADEIGWKFLADAVHLRYPANDDPREGPVELIDIPTDSGWTADYQTWEDGITEIAPFAESVSESDDFWLPTRDMAYIYRGHATRDRPIEFTSPTNGTDVSWSEVNPGDTVDIAVSVGGLPTVESVEVFDGSTSIAEMTSPPYTATWTAEGVGAHELVAVATLQDGSQRTGYVAPVLVLGTIEHPGGGLPGGGGDDGGDGADDGSDGADDGSDDGGGADGGDGDGDSGCGCRTGANGSPTTALLLAATLVGLGCSLLASNRPSERVRRGADEVGGTPSK